MIMTESLALEFDQTNPGNRAQKAARREASIPHFNLNGDRIQAVAGGAYFFASSEKNALKISSDLTSSSAAISARSMGLL